MQCLRATTLKCGGATMTAGTERTLAYPRRQKNHNRGMQARDYRTSINWRTLDPGPAPFPRSRKLEKNEVRLGPPLDLRRLREDSPEAAHYGRVMRSDILAGYMRQSYKIDQLCTMPTARDCPIS